MMSAAGVKGEAKETPSKATRVADGESSLALLPEEL